MSIEKLEEYITTADLSKLEALLMQTPALATTPTSHGVSPLMLSCYYKKPAVTDVLLRYVNEINLFEASAAGKLEVVTHFVETSPSSLDDYAPDGFTALGLACYFGHEAVARYLVTSGADVNRSSNNGFQVYPIHSACADNNTAIARILVNNGAEVNVKQQAGATPLHAAAQNGNIDLLVLLLEHGALTNIRMEGGKLPADLAREKGFDEIAEILS